MVKSKLNECSEGLEARVVHRETWRRVSGTLCFALGLALLAGCSQTGGGPSDPGATALPAGESCGSIREQLNKLDRKGAQSSVEAQNAGRKLSAGQKADADAYNRLLGQYLGSRCHV